MGNYLESFKKLVYYDVVELDVYALGILLMSIVLTIAGCLLVIRYLCYKRIRDFFSPQKCNCWVMPSILAYIGAMIIVAMTSPLIVLFCLPVSLGILIVLIPMTKIVKIGKFLDDIAEMSNRRLKGVLHCILGAVFPNLISTKTYTKNIEGTRESGGFVVIDGAYGHVTTEIDEKAEKRQVYLFGDKEFKIERCPCFHPVLVHGYTYFYFILVGIVAFHWFMAMVADNLLYRKTTTCKDINVKDSSFSCFTINNHTLIDCKDVMDNVPIICYLYHGLTLAAFGIGFSVFHSIIFGVTVYFKFAVKIAESKCGKCVLILFQILLTVIPLFVLPSILPTVHFLTASNVYFFYGNAAIRWVMFVLICITPAILVNVPWCGFTHRTVYMDTVLEERTQQNIVSSQPVASVTQPDDNRRVSQPDDSRRVSQPSDEHPVGDD